MVFSCHWEGFAEVFFSLQWIVFFRTTDNTVSKGFYAQLAGLLLYTFDNQAYILAYVGDVFVWQSSNENLVKLRN